MKAEVAKREIESLDYYLQNYTNDYSEESHTAMMMAMQALEQEPKTGWIPVSERLPEIHQDVLLSFRSLDVEVGFRGNTEPYYYCHGDYIEPQNVLAWQPLPEPYKAEGSEE